MLKQFEVRANGEVIGVYDAKDHQEAHDLCAQDAGYDSEDDMMRRLNQASEFVSREIQGE